MTLVNVMQLPRYEGTSHVGPYWCTGPTVVIIQLSILTLCAL